MGNREGPSFRSNERQNNLAHFLFEKIVGISKEQNITSAERIGAMYSLYRIFLNGSKDNLHGAETIMELKILLRETGMGLPDVFKRWYDDTIRDIKMTDWEKKDDDGDYPFHMAGEGTMLDVISGTGERREGFSSYNDEELKRINKTAKLIYDLAFKNKFIFLGFRFSAENILRAKFKEFKEAFGKEKAKEMIKGVMGNVIKTVSFNIEALKKKSEQNEKILKRLRSILKTLKAMLSNIDLFWK